MMIGVAQVIGMKPTLRSFFSGSAALREHFGRGLAGRIARSSLSGKNCDTAATAVAAPTDFRNARRATSCGNIARITAEATTPS